jgi:hypothetical protein
MAREFKMDIPVAAMENASLEFHQAYGTVLAEWANVERALFYWFWMLTGMKDAMARAVFYSGRSFNARADMLSAVIDTLHPPEKIGPMREDLFFIKAGLKKSWSYSGFRNHATHGLPLMNITDDGLSFTLVQGDTVKKDDAGISIDHLLNAAENYDILKQAMIDALPSHRQKSGLTIQQCLEQVRSLPTQTYSKNGLSSKEPAPPLPPDLAAQRTRAEQAARHVRRGAMARISLSGKGDPFRKPTQDRKPDKTE